MKKYKADDFFTDFLSDSDDQYAQKTHTPLIHGNYSSLEDETETMLDNLIKTNATSAPIQKIDDRECKLFKNFVDFSCSTDGLNMPPFAKQAAIGTQLFAEWCVSADSVLITSNGIKDISEVVGNNRQLTPLPPFMTASLLGNNKSSLGGSFGVQNAIKITTVHGSTITGTLDHLTYVYSNGEFKYKALDTITTSDYLVAKIGTELWSEEDAYVPSDWYNNRSIRDIAFDLGKLFHTDEEEHEGIKLTQYEVPIEIRESTFDSVILYLQGVLYKRDPKQIPYCRFLNAILRNIGVITHVYKHKILRCEVIVICTYGVNYINMYKEGDVYEKYNAIIPITEYEKIILADVSKTSVFPHRFSSHFYNTFIRKQELKKKDRALYERLQFIIENKLVLEKVTNSTLVGQIEVFDINVPRGENFLCNSLVTHNCPKCTHSKYHDFTNIPVDMEIKDFRKKVKLLENGKCPSCGKTRLHYYKKHKLNIYKGLVGIAGQRCITGDSIVVTKRGLFRMESIHKQQRGYTYTGPDVFNGSKIVQPTAWFNYYSATIKIILANGTSLQASPNHPILINDEWVEFKDLHIGDKIKVINTSWYGSNKKPVTYNYENEIPDKVLQGNQKVQLHYVESVCNKGIKTDDGIILSKYPKHFSVLLTNVHKGSFLLGNKLLVLENPIKHTFITNIEITEETQVYDFHIPDGHKFIANSLTNHNSGKSAFMSLCIPYQLHRWLKMPSPNQHLGLLNNTVLTGTLTALTFQKAVELLYQPVQNAVMDSMWFKTLFQILDDYESNTGQSLYRIKDTFMVFNHKNLTLSCSGPNKRTLRGSTRWLAIIDELGWFPHGEDSDERERASANEVYTSLENSLTTVQAASMRVIEAGYYDTPMALNIGISSPSSIRDKVMQLHGIHHGGRDLLTFQLPTWEMNPYMPRKTFDSKFKEDYVKAMRDFGAEPPKSENQWLGEYDLIQRMFQTKYSLSYQYVDKTAKSGKAYRYAVSNGQIAPVTMLPTILTLDAGLSDNSFAFTIQSARQIKDNSGGIKYGCETFCAVEVAPSKGECVINHTKLIRELIYKLIKLYNVVLVVADRWNSVKTLQDIEEDMGIYVEQYSLKVADCTFYKECIEDDQLSEPYLILPRTEMSFGKIEEVDLENYPHCFKYKPISHLYFQHITAATDYRGMVQKGNGLTDDILRAQILGFTYVTNPNIIHKYKLLSDLSVNRTVAIGTRGNGSASTNSNIGVRG